MNMIFKSVKKVVKSVKMRWAFLYAFLIASSYQWYFSPVSYAAGEDPVAIIKKFGTWLCGIIAAIGLVTLAIGGFKYAQAHKNSQQGNEHEGVNTITAGAIMFGIGTVLTALGVSLS